MAYRTSPARYPIAKLAEQLHVAGPVELSVELGVTYNWLRRLEHSGLDHHQADIFACRVGLVPELVWDDWLNDPQPESVREQKRARRSTAGMTDDKRSPFAESASPPSGWPTARYATIVADPPWPYDDQPFTWRKQAGATRFLPYSTMSLDEIAALPVVDLARPSSHLYLWTTNRFLFAARDVMMGWGFDYAQTLVWCKDPGAAAKAVGTYNIATEFVLFGRRTISERRQVERAGALIRQARVDAGINRAELHRLVRGGTPTGIVARWEDNDSLPNATDWERLQQVLPVLVDVERPIVEPPPERSISRAERNWWEWPRGAHSEKPPAFLDIVEQVSPGPYVELFARAPRLGWDSWGYGYEEASGVA